MGSAPTIKAPRLAPCSARSLVTVSEPEFVAQMLEPSQATRWGSVPTWIGPAPTGKLPKAAASAALWSNGIVASKKVAMIHALRAAQRRRPSFGRVRE
jgi:hypothetical protein